MTEAVRVMAVGSVMVDLLAVGLPQVAAPGHVVYTDRPIESLIGGHPVDVAIDLAKLGYPAAAVGLAAAVGEGLYGSYVTRVIESYGLRSFLQRGSLHDTGKNLVLGVEGEDRRFHIDPGANWDLEPKHVAGALEQFAPQVLTLRPGYTGIDHHLPELLGPLEDVLVILDIMQPHPSRPPGLVLSALQHVDIVHCNRTEALAVTGADSVEGAISLLLRLGPQMVLLTAGGDGAQACTRTHTVTQPGFRVDVVDVTGCGDAFCAGVIEWLAGAVGSPTRAALEAMTADDLARLLAHAQAVGAAAATRVGCVEGVTRPVVEGLRTDQAPQVLAATVTAAAASGT